MSKISQIFPFSFQIQNHPFLIAVDHLPTCHILLNRKAALQIGGFSSALQKYGEDLDFTHRAYNANYRFFFLPAAQVIHWQNMSLFKWLTKIFHWGRIQIPVQRMNSSRGVRLYRLLPLLILLSWLGISAYSPLFFLSSLLVLTALSVISIGTVGFIMTLFTYACGELVETIWPLFEYRNEQELKALDSALENQYSVANKPTEI